MPNNHKKTTKRCKTSRKRYRMTINRHKMIQNHCKTSKKSPPKDAKQPRTKWLCGLWSVCVSFSRRIEGAIYMSVLRGPLHHNLSIITTNFSRGPNIPTRLSTSYNREIKGKTKWSHKINYIFVMEQRKYNESVMIQPDPESIIRDYVQF